MADFSFTVVASGLPAEVEADEINVFDRFNNADINLDGRYGPFTTDPQQDTYTLSVSLFPAQLEIGQATQVAIQARVNGLPVVGQTIQIETSDANVGLVPTEVYTGAEGLVVFQVIALALGAATITASMVVDGVTYPSNGAVFTVTTLDAPEDYDATGYGQVILSIESPLANALQARVQRLSNQEQIRKYPTDTGLHRLSSYENLEVTFLPPFLQ